ncbi:MAG: type IX secretion system membrane protein PorP/SprF [Fimbriimonadaceae bacterium]|nr:type IX secretion system membrane protein PorP/SprF [Chitinophagales bacterium]
MKIFLRSITFSFSLFICMYVCAQDAPQFSQYMFNPLQFNPAVAGNQQAIVTTIDARNQWVGIPEAPQTQSLTFHMPLYKISSGAGIHIINDNAGQQKTTGITLNYAYKKNFKNSTLSFGLYGGVVQRTLDGSKLISPTGSYNDGTIDHNDDNIPISLESSVIPDAGGGIYFQSNKFYAGVSANHLLNNYFSFNTENGPASIQYNPAGYVTAGYKILIADKFGVTPNVLYKMDLAENMVDFNAIFDYKDNIFVGASFRGNLKQQTDAVVLIGGWNISEKLGISYSYDVTLSEINTVSDGSHEIILRYRIFVEKPRAGKEINNLRYLYY